MKMRQVENEVTDFLLHMAPLLHPKLLEYSIFYSIYGSCPLNWIVCQKFTIGEHGAMIHIKHFTNSTN